MAQKSNAKPRVLVVDDGTTYAEVIAARMPEVALVDPRGYGEMGRIADGPGTLSFLEMHRNEVDVVLLDMHFDIPEEQLFMLDKGASVRKTRRFQGVAILREIRSRFPELPVVLLTSIRDLSPVDAAGELRSQSMTYFLDGEDLDALRIRINAACQETGGDDEGSHVIWGDDPAIRAMRRRLSMLARGRMPVILEGATGTGKSFLAEHCIHKESGRPGPFVVCDLATVPLDLIPAHLFGAMRGAYTGSVTDRKGLFEMAHQGTLFIDEVQNIPREVQKQLLQALQEHRVRPLGSAREVQVDVKVIAASNRPLDEAVAARRFRSDLYMRLSPARRVRIPPLAERLGDLEFLARRFVEQAVRDPDVEDLANQVTDAVGIPRGAPVELVTGRPEAGAKRKGKLVLLLPDPAWQMLAAHRWPGNLRELENVMQNIVTFTLIGAVDAIRDGMPIRASRLQIDPGLIGELLAGSAILSETGKGATKRSDSPRAFQVELHHAASLNGVASDVEKQYFLELYSRTGGDFDTMAEFLLADKQKGRAVRLRFNQLGLKVREISSK